MARLPHERVQFKRAYEPAAPEDGTRVLIDRLWPRGIAKVDAAIELWMKDIAPSAELRTWFGHDPAKFQEFRRRYRKELHTHADLLEQLRDFARKGTLTLVYSAHDEAHNDAVVLRELLLEP